ncbi:succinyldiaminopimelate transaminase [Nesterenkonia alba]|uniref:succinyldiaminopimelate transaminase n=1 Tax=Nesterenkonia alba TaxID=515814 RepID=UPI0003B35E27|nr:succinyldiaminopimelate transaminase [Nesterenkonia alba]
MLNLPEYPWDAMAPYRQRAEEHPDGAVNLSIGTPVDPTPQVVRAALSEAADAPGYPTTHGTAALRQAVTDWFARRRGVPGLDPEAVLPTIGSKEFVAWLPTLLGLGYGDIVVRPEIAYPTYDMGAVIAGAKPVAADDPTQLDELTLQNVKLIWVNSPGNPTGRVDDVATLRQIVHLARRIGAVVASDECYAELPWEAEEVPSILDKRVSEGDSSGLLAVYSASKQSNLAGYRAAFVAGCPVLIRGLLNARKQAGMIMPAPVQAALTAALNDDAHVTAQREVYRRRREVLKPALQAAGFTVEHSEAGLYLWCTDGSGDTWKQVDALSQRGIIVGPGTFYGDAGQGYIRVALTARDERIDAAADRLRGSFVV